MSLALLLGLTWNQEIKSEGLGIFMLLYCVIFDIALLIKIGGS